MKNYFKIIMYTENEKGEFDKFASFEGKNTFDGIKKLIKYYEKIYSLHKKETT